ncbi:MAG TPA: hypothetical protein VIJ14_08130 [Rhabdochlamydiaceae bacterium]
MDKLIEILNTFNLPTVITMAAIFWYFTRDMKSEMKALEAKMDAQLAAQSARTDRLYEMFIDLLRK